MTNPGKLFIVATPIGNLGDITFRAIETLKESDIIAAEDTRHSKKLLNHYKIETKTISLHNFNEAKRCELILTKIKQGKNVALITDAGTPLISDPGNLLVKKAYEHEIQVIPIPGASALISALSAAGLPTNKFVFEGFLPTKKKQRLEHLQKLNNESRTIIFYESPHRLLATIDNMQDVFGPERYIVIAKELTKKFETIYGDNISEIQSWLQEKPERLKGEFVILVKGLNKEAEIDHKILRILGLLSENMPLKQAAMLASKITGIKKNKLYKFLIKTTKLEKN